MSGRRVSEVERGDVDVAEEKSGERQKLGMPGGSARVESYGESDTA
ncbi:MAG: hypothetical protein GY801_19680 [bacterium]|nr:hypothetical protein [bacterium]